MGFPIQHKTTIRVRYPETDSMGYVHHSVYPQYYELARVEMLRERGISYKKMEEDGIILPVRELHITYNKPARFDDILIITSTITKPPGLTLLFNFEIHTNNNELINSAEVCLVFADAHTGKPLRNAHTYLASAFHT